MSGGSFDYAFMVADRFADELENKIKNNHIPDEYDYAHEFSLKTVDALEGIVAQVRQSALLMKEVEWLYSGDIDETDFIERVNANVYLALLANNLDRIVEGVVAGVADSLREWEEAKREDK